MRQKIISSKKHKYQLNFSASYQRLYNQKGRRIKAKKILAVLKNHFKGHLAHLALLDVGSSTGIMTEYLSRYFKETTGIDIDQKAILFSQKHFSGPKLRFLLEDSMNLKFPTNSFDVIVCSQIYEHVPDSTQLMSEIYRVLKPNGVCYFSAGNRLVFIEEHYHLPLLSVIPKFMAHRYLQLLKRGNFYYENHQSLWGLKKLTSKFKIIDYTKKIIDNPTKYQATDTLVPGSSLHHFAKFIVRHLYWLCPNYIWLLQKPTHAKH